MYRMSVAAACAAMLFALSTAAAPAGVPNGLVAASASSRQHSPLIIKVGLGPEGHRVIVTIGCRTYTAGRFALDPDSFAYNPVDGNINQLPTPAENVNPTSGIGVVIKRSPGQNYSRVSGPDSHGTWTIDPSTMPAGNYEIVVTVPAHAINTKGTGAAERAT